MEIAGKGVGPGNLGIGAGLHPGSNILELRNLAVEDSKRNVDGGIGLRESGRRSVLREAERVGADQTPKPSALERQRREKSRVDLFRFIAFPELGIVLRGSPKD